MPSCLKDNAGTMNILLGNLTIGGSLLVYWLLVDFFVNQSNVAEIALPFGRVTAGCASNYAQVKHLHGSVRHVDVSYFPKRFSAFRTLHALESLFNYCVNPLFTETRQAPSLFTKRES